MDDPRPPLHRRLARRRWLLQATADVAAWAVALGAAMVLRFEFRVDDGSWGSFSAAGLVAAWAIAAACQLVFGLLLGLYHGRFRYGSFEEVLHQASAVVGAGAALALVNQVAATQLVPLSVVVTGAALTLAVSSGVRYIWRLLRERAVRPSAEQATRVLIFGAGEGGLQVITAMMRNPASPYYPVALIDDDPAKRHLRINGVRVAGNRGALAHQARKHRAEAVIIAVPSASAELIRDVSELALRADLQVLVLPTLGELFDGAVTLGDIRPVTEADLLGRHVIQTDVASIAGFLAGKRVLVTGAGGSIGSELCHQIAHFNPGQLVMLDRDESALHALQLRLSGRAMLDTPDLVVADIRDAERVQQVFAEHRPQVVFHAAALKHLPLLELHPSEALKTNVLATQHVLDAASDHGVERFVNISTDKAADPTSVLGYTKRIAERLTAATAATASGTYLSVRFGNVLGSRGSVLTAFRAQVEAGGPITVTHPDVTRYFMTIPEAVELVIQGAVIGRDGEALVLDMGDPVRIDDVARRLAAEADRPIEITYTGLRPGEKLHEVLFGDGEGDERPVHRLISHVPVPALSIDSVRGATSGLDRRQLVAELQVLTGASAGSASFL